MRLAPWMMSTVIVLAPLGSAWALEGDGLTLHGQDMQWSRWQARLSLGGITSQLGAEPNGNTDGKALTLSSASLLGDYYFSGSLRSPSDGGGFRATSGMFVGSRSSLLSINPLASGRVLNVERRNLGGGLALMPSFDNGSESSAVPYLGVGYTGLSGKSGWGFSADIGLMALSPGSAVKLGRVFTGNQSLDDALHEMRLSPLLQLGVSYSF